MATLGDIGLAAAINILTAIAFLLAFAILKMQPMNDRVYFPKWYLKGSRNSPKHSGAFVRKFVNLDYRTYLKFLNWMPEALRMPETDLIDHAGLDSAVYLRIYLVGLKIFVPLTVLAFTVLVPVDATAGALNHLDKDLVFSDIDKLSISNVKSGSHRFWAHLVMAYMFAMWACYVLYGEYETIASMRLQFIASEHRRPDQFTAAAERERVLKDPKAIMPVAFVSFKSRWGAAVCAQTQQSKNPTVWLTEWASEPRDVYWHNLAIPFVELTVRRLVIAIAVFFLIFFFMIPITIVQSLANIEGIEKAAPFLKSVIEVKVIKAFIQGFLSGLALKLFLILLPTILMILSKIEGYSSLSVLERKSAAKYYYFILVNVFLGSIIAGTAFQQLDKFIHQSATEIPKTIGETIPMKATFFITYIMVDGWAGIAGEILRLKPLIFFHLKNMFLVKTEKDRENAMDPGSVGFAEALPTLQLYFLLGLVYATITPILLPFIVFYFGFAYLVYRHQVINVYNQEYESAAAFWPHVHSRIIAGLVISQVLLLGLLSTKDAAQLTPLLIGLPILTIWFHKFCKNRFEPAFRRYPIEEATIKDTLEQVTEPNLNLKGYLRNAYIHPVFKTDEDDKDDEYGMGDSKEDDTLVLTKRQSRTNTPGTSRNVPSTSPADCGSEP